MQDINLNEKKKLNFFEKQIKCVRITKSKQLHNQKTVNESDNM